MRSPRIVYLQYTNPADYPPLLHSARILAERGCDILFLGTGSHGSPDLEVEPHPRVQSERWPYQPGGARQKLHYLRFGQWALRRLRQSRADWCYASDLWSCPIAALTDVPVVYHEHDTPGDPESLVRGLLLRARASVVKRARLCVLPNETRRRAFSNRFPRARTVSVLNCPLRDEIRPGAPPANELVLYYHGSLVPERLPIAVIDALAQLPQFVRLRFAGYETIGAPCHAACLLARAQAAGVDRRVEYLGKVPARTQLLAQLAAAHVGLAFVPNDARDFNLRTMAGASNKPFEYLAAALPVLVTDRPDWRSLFVEPGYALACDPDDASSIAAAVRRLADSPEQRSLMGERGRQRVPSEWNYESQFEPVLQLLLGEGAA